MRPSELRRQARALPLRGGFVSPEASALFAEARRIEEQAKRRADTARLDRRLASLEAQVQAQRDSK